MKENNKQLIITWKDQDEGQAMMQTEQHGNIRPFDIFLLADHILTDLSIKAGRDYAEAITALLLVHKHVTRTTIEINKKGAADELSES